jgi:hypothetical protein
MSLLLLLLLLRIYYINSGKYELHEKASSFRSIMLIAEDSHVVFFSEEAIYGHSNQII